MELSSFVRRISALKNELLSILPKVTNAKTYLSNMDQIFMILTLIKLGTEFDNIREQILTGSTTRTFDDIFARLLHHSSTATPSRSFKVSNETWIMLAPSHPRGDSRSIRGDHRGRGCQYLPFSLFSLHYNYISLDYVSLFSLLHSCISLDYLSKIVILTIFTVVLLYFFQK